MPRSKYTKGKDGYYSTKRWDGTYTATGKKHLVCIRSKKSSRDLERLVDEFEKQLQESGGAIPEEISFFEYAKRWEEVYKGGKEGGTREMYQRAIKHYFERFKAIQPRELRQSDFQMLLTEISGKPRTCQIVYDTFSQVLRSAARDRLISRSNAEDILDIKRPSYRANEKRTLTTSERKALMTADFTVKERACILTLYGCGLRRGELLALTPFSVDLKAKTLSITRAVGYKNRVPYLKTPKSDRGTRTVPMPEYTAKALQTLIESRDDSSPYLFPMDHVSVNSRPGELMTADAYMTFFEQIRRKINLEIGGSPERDLCPDLTSHIFRHTYCSNLCYQIPLISVKKIAQLMGDTEEMVNRVYSHIIEEQENVDAAILQATAI